MIEKILHFSLRFPLLIVLLTVAAMGYGIYSLSRLPIDAVPDITNNQVQINATVPGFSPIQMEKQVTYLIETSLKGIPGLEMTRSLSRNGFAQVTAIFSDAVNLYFARQQINERLTEVKEGLPESAEVRMGPVSTGLGEVYMWTVDYAHPQKEFQTPEGRILKNEYEKNAYLREVQDWIIKPQMKGVSGLADVDSIGGYVKQYHVQPDMEKMMALGLSLDQLTDILRKNNFSSGPGFIEKGGEAFLIKADERLATPEQIEAIIVASPGGIPTRVKDIAEVVIGKEQRTGSATRNGHEAVVGTALMLIGENSRTVAQAVEKKLKEIASSLPEGVQVTEVLNRTKLVNGTVATVAKNLSEGAILVIAILFLFLRQVRAALIVASVIPLTLFLTAIGMVQTKISGNLMSLGALDFGLIVDGAVIITENCLRKLSEKTSWSAQERLEQLQIASKEMIRPTLFGQAIIILVYVPILALSGVEGKMFHPMAMTVIFALFSAFILSVTFVPAMASLFLKGEDLKTAKLMDGLKALYQPILEKVLTFPKSFILSGCALFALSLFLFTQLGEEFIPTLDEKDIAMHAVRIPSTSLSESTKMQRKVETVLAAFPEVAHVYSKTGTAETALDPMPPNVSDTFIILKSQKEWPNPDLAKGELIKKMQAALNELPGNSYEFTQPIEMRFNELISGVRSDVAIKIYGDEFDVMQKTAETLAKTLEKIPGAADVKTTQTTGLPVLEAKINRDQASSLGVNPYDAIQVLSLATGGGFAGQIFEGDRRFDILVKLKENQRSDLDTLGHLPIPLPHGKKYATLNEVADLSITEGLNEVHRENGKRFVTVQANVRNRDLGSFVMEAQNKIQHSVQIPHGYWLSWGGQFENLLSARDRLLFVVPLCLSLIFILLYMALHSFPQALMVFSAIPFALSGGTLALWLRDIPFSISAAVGFIALSGIAVLNGLVLISSIEEHKGKPLRQAIIEGALQRLRPVLMTALVASFGFVPMALATGTGAEVQKPLATVVIGGLLTSTILTLIILPALIFLFNLEQREVEPSQT